MNITFLIGNGFDLNLGLDTTYSSFIKEYKKVPAEEGSCLEFFKTKILKDEDLWSNAEEAFGIATESFVKQGYNAEDFCDCHSDFCDQLAEYLESQEKRIHFESIENIFANMFAEGIKNYSKGFRDEEQEIINSVISSSPGGFKYNFITFNYTSLINKIISPLKRLQLLGIRGTTRGQFSNSVEKVHHIHGTTEMDMVLGVNDITQIKDTELFKGADEEFINQIIKPKTNEINQRNSDSIAYEILNKSNIIYIYGMSIGKTDKIWWERICLLMNKNKNLHLIIHDYDAPEDKRIRTKFLIYCKKKRKKFTSYIDLDTTEKEDIESRIHIDRSNIFAGLCKIVDIKENTEKKDLTTA